MSPASCVQMDERKQWALALSTVQPIAQMQTLSWNQRLAERVKQLSSSLYRCTAFSACLCSSCRSLRPVGDATAERFEVLCTCRRAGEALSRPSATSKGASSGTAQPGTPQAPTAPEVAADYAESWKPVDAPPQACIHAHPTSLSWAATCVLLRARTWLKTCCMCVTTCHRYALHQAIDRQRQSRRLRGCARTGRGACMTIWSSCLICPQKRSWRRASEQYKQLSLQQSMKRRSDKSLCCQYRKLILAQVCSHQARIAM